MFRTHVEIRRPADGRTPMHNALTNEARLQMVNLKLVAVESLPLLFCHLNINGANPGTIKSCGYNLISFAVSFKLPLFIIKIRLTKMGIITGVKYASNLISKCRMFGIDEDAYCCDVV